MISQKPQKTVEHFFKREETTVLNLAKITITEKQARGIMMTTSMGPEDMEEGVPSPDFIARLHESRYLLRTIAKAVLNSPHNITPVLDFAKTLRAEMMPKAKEEEAH